MSENVQRFAADFKKVPGVLSVTASQVAWVPNTPGSMDRQSQALNRVTNMLASKAGAAKVSLKLVFKEDIPAGGLLFTFTNPTVQNRESDRLIVQDLLIPFVSANKGITPHPPGPSVSTPQSSVPGTPAAIVGAKRKLQDESNADSPAGSNGSGTPVAGTPAKQKQMDHLRKMKMRVLEKNPALAALYKELVWQPEDPSMKISEKEFWFGREALIRAEEVAQAQKPGRQPRLIDDRFALGNSKSGGGGIGGTGKGIKSKDDGGPQIFSLRPEDIKQIFEEFPVVADAYARYVPGISETEFWTRYFQSQLWEQQRASERRTVNASDEGNKRKDDIFDQYLEDPDWNVQPKERQPDDVERFLDLSATEEDHGETSTQRDPTMQAGRERGALPLIRRFNANAARLSRGGQSQETATTSTGGYLNTALPDNVNIYDEIDLEDLRGPAVEETISLEVAHADAADGGDRVSKRVLPQNSEEELKRLAEEYTTDILGYSPSFANVSLPTPAGGWEKNRIESGNSAAQAKAFQRYQAQKSGAEAAALVVKEMYVASNAENAATVPLPEAVFEQMRSCHNAATEFLRQYWSALLPLPTGALGATGPTVIPKNKEARDPIKAAKMAKYLAMTERKIEAVVQTAVIAGVDGGRVRAALAPTLGAVNVALAREVARAG